MRPAKARPRRIAVGAFVIARFCPMAPTGGYGLYDAMTHWRTLLALGTTLPPSRARAPPASV